MLRMIGIPLLMLLAFNTFCYADEFTQIKEQVSNLYSKKFIAENHFLRLEELKPYLGSSLFSLLRDSYTNTSGEKSLDFDPFENAQDSWDSFSIQSPTVSQNLASVAVLFSGMGGNKSEKGEVYLQFEKQSSGQWVINDIYYPNSGISLVQTLSGNSEPTSGSLIHEEKNPDQLIAKVKSSLLENTNFSLDYTFKFLCRESKWRYFTSKKGQDIVEFSGSVKEEFLIPGKSLPFCIQFSLDPDNLAPTVVYSEAEGEKQFPELCHSNLRQWLEFSKQKPTEEVNPPSKVE